MTLYICAAHTEPVDEENYTSTHMDSYRGAGSQQRDNDGTIDNIIWLCSYVNIAANLFQMNAWELDITLLHIFRSTIPGCLSCLFYLLLQLGNSAEDLASVYHKGMI